MRSGCGGDCYRALWPGSAQFILSSETDDKANRNVLIADILKYNEEDLAATWAVFE